MSARPRNCETDDTRSSRECSDPTCPHAWKDCTWSAGADECPHWHKEPDIPVPVTAEMVEAAELLDASGAELLDHAINSALRGGQS
jgi:hypothetical protein